MLKHVLLAMVLMTFNGCASGLLTSQCEVPPMYKQVNTGLIDPTWEPEAEMRSQIEGLSDNELVCWYGNPDGSVTARVNMSPGGYDSYLFRKAGERWSLVESGGVVITG